MDTIRCNPLLRPLVAALALACGALAPMAALAAGAANSNTVLIDGTGGNTGAAVHVTQAGLLGFTTELVTSTAVWTAKSTDDFKTYKAIVFPDAKCGARSSMAADTRTTWGPAVTGNILIIGGDPEYHAQSKAGATKLIKNGIGFAANDPGKTGLLFPVGCSASSAGLLDQFGSFTAESQSSDSIHIVAVHTALSGLSDADLSNWGTSTHLKFTAYPSTFIPLAIQTNGTGTGILTFEDGSTGTQFMLVRGSGVQPVGLNLGATGPATETAGTAFSYTLTYGNTGGTDATGVVITAPVPTGTTFVSATGGGTESGGTVTWSIGNLAAHTTGLTVTYTVTPGSAGTTTMSGAQITNGTKTSTAGDVVTTVTAPLTGITVSSGSSSYAYPGSAVAVDPGVLVESSSNLNNAVVDIASGFVVGQDVLSFTESGGITGSYNATTGVLTLSGNASAAAYQAVLRTVSYSNSAGASASTGARTISFSLGSGLSYGGTGHFYEFVASSGITWDNAVTAAAARTYFGLRGYLVTVTSAGENEFVKAKLAQNAWMGLSTDDADFTRTWKWATGPEAGTNICTNPSAGVCTPISGAYTNWHSGEPNNAGGESKGHFYASDGLWNDFSPTNSSIGGYVVEYGGMTGDPSVVLSGTRDVTVSLATSTTVSSSAPGAVWGEAVSFTATVSPSSATGTVQFKIDGSNFGSPVTLNGSGQAISGSISSLSVAGHTISAVYAGDSTHGASTGEYSQAVARASTGIAVGASSTSVIFGASVTLTATVTVATPGAGTPGGTVSFEVGEVTIPGCSARTLVGGTTATCITTSLPVGSNPVVAVLLGDADFDGAISAATTVTVSKATPTVALASSKTLSTWGEPVTFSVTVASTAGVPTGQVIVKDGATTVCGPVALVSGSASCSSRTVALGTRTLTAVYAGDGSFNGGTSPPLSQLQVRGTTTSDVVADRSESVYGQAVVLTATVYPDAPSEEIPTGTITFRDSAGVLCASVAVDGSGTATCTTTSLSVGVHALSGRYNGSTGYSPSTSFSYAVKVDRASTQVALAASPTSSVFGQAVGFTITVPAVLPGAGVATGTVSLTDGGVAVAGCTDLPLSGASASCSTAALSVGSHTLGVSYGGDGNFVASSASATFTVAKATTTTTLATSLTPSVFGQEVTVTATVAASAPGAGSPTGTVIFRDGATVLGTSAVSGGAATWTGTGLNVATHPITAVYSGDGSFLTSTSSTLAQVVNKASVSAAVLTSLTPSVFGQPVAFSVSVEAVTPGAGTPTGTVTLADGGTAFATLTLSGGSASGSTSALAVGSHTITASYAGDAGFLTGTASVAQVVNKATASTGLVAGVNPSKFGQSVTLTASVGSVAPGAGTPTGTVTIESGSTRLCGPLTLSGGAASCAVASLAVGTHPLTATYSGSASHLAGSPAEMTQAVVRADTRLVLDEPPPRSLYGEPIVLTAHVAAVAPGAGSPTGTIDFYDNETLLGSATVDDITGVATFTVASSAPLSIGDHAFLATYGGDGSFTGSMTELSTSHAIDPGSVVVALSFTPTSSVWGQPVEVSVALSAIAPAVGIPGGTVEIVEGGVVIQTLTLDTAGSARWTTSALAVATHSLTARYLGVTEWLAETSSERSLVVGQAATSTALALSPTSTLFGEPLVLTATVRAIAPGAGSPGGTVTFLDGSTFLGTGLVDPDTGVATLTSATLVVGAHSFSASYGGDSHFSVSSTEATGLDVNQTPVAVALASSSAPSVFGQSVSFSVSVTAVSPGAGTPSGTVVLMDGGTTIGTLTLSGGTASFTTSSLALGSHTLLASYAGDGSFQAGSAGTTQVVGQAQSATELSAAPAPSLAGQAITLTARVSARAPGGGVPTGTVQFREGSTLLGTGTLDGSGVASATATLQLAGSHTIQAAYGGSEEHANSSATLTQVVGRVTPALALSSSPSPSMYGQAVTLAVVVSAQAPGAGSPTGTITFLDGGTVIGSGQLDGSGRATFSLSSLVAGDHAITAAYAGDANFLAGTTATALRQTVAQGTASVAVASSRNPSRRGRPVVLIATVTSPHAVPTGTVTFKDGDTVLGTGTLQDGVAHLTVRSLVKGTHAITAASAGVADFAAGQGTLPDGQVVENTPPVAGSGTGIAFGPAGATAVTIADTHGALAPATGTVELWVKPAWSAAGDVTGTPSILRVGPTDAPGYALGVSASRRQLVVTSSAGTTGYAAPLDDGGWHHVALRSTAGTVTALVDGIEVASSSGSFATASGSLVLGEGFHGELDELRVWSTARTAAELAANQRRPLHGDEAGLIGYWRLDEGAGVELFDASPSALDGAIALADGASEAFVPSAAWRHRVGQQERPFAPIDAGYDADGDPLTMAVVTVAGHGTATLDRPALQVDYVPGATFLGDDTFAYSLTDDGGLSSSYTIDVTVERILVCQATADCGGGDLCVQGICTAGTAVLGKSGSGGCSTGGGAASILWAGLILGLLAWRPTRSRPGARRLLAALLLAGGAVTAQAQVTPPHALPSGFALQLYEPTPAGDRFFTVSGSTAPGHLSPAAGLVLSWATDPLVLHRGSTPIAGGRIVQRQVWGWAVGSLGLGDRVLVDVAVPVALSQTGSQPFPDLAKVAASGLGDLRLGARYLIPWGGPFDLAAGLNLWFPTGAKGAFASDGGVRVEPKLIGTLRQGAMEYGAELGLLYREQKEIVVTELGSAVSFAAGAAWRWDSFRVGPEIYGHYQFKGTTTSPVELLLGGRYEQCEFDYGLAVSTELTRAPGASPFRLVAQLGWRPGACEAARLAAERKAEAERSALAAAEAAHVEAARRAIEAELAAQQAAAARAEAERVAAEKAAAAREAAALAAATPPPPPPEPALAKLTAERIEIMQSVQFETDKDVIRPESEPLLHDVAAVILAHPELVRIRVEGHTDSLGPADYNTRLSGQRAAAVTRWLVEKGGVEAARLEAKGFGSSQPVTGNETREGRARNRRVDFKLVAAP